MTHQFNIPSFRRAVWIDCQLCCRPMYRASCNYHKKWKGSKQQRHNSTGLQPWSLEAGDTKILLHVQGIIQSGFKKVMIVANYSDAVVMYLYAFFDFGISQTVDWVWFPCHKKLRLTRIKTPQS